MNSVIGTMLERYNPQNNDERENAIKEIIQEIALAGLSRGGFSEKAAFYGGTCLRMFHGLNRFRMLNGNPRLFNCRDESDHIENYIRNKLLKLIYILSGV